jgi:hypothetical protein
LIAYKKKHEIPLSAVPCLAYRRRKEDVERQIREHNAAKQAASRCPITGIGNENESSSASSTALATKAASASEKTDTKINSLEPNKKFTVSIQSNSEKQKESLLSKRFLHLLQFL